MAWHQLLLKYEIEIKQTLIEVDVDRKREYNCVYKDPIERDSKQDKQLAISGTPLCQSWEIFMQGKQIPVVTTSKISNIPLLAGAESAFRLSEWK